MGRPAWSYNFGVLMVVICPCHAIIMDSIYWNTSNIKFIRGQGMVLHPQIGDKVDIVCPRARPGVAGRPEYHRVYLVTRSQMERCIIGKSDTPLLNCDKPDRDVKFTFKFQEFSPNLWGLEFLRGRDYYITSTSTGMLHGLDNTDGGVCRSKSMKLILRVGQSASDPPTTPQDSPTRHPPRRPKPGGKDLATKHTNNTSEKKGEVEKEDGRSETGLLVGAASGGVVVVVLIVAVLLVLLWRYRGQRCRPEGHQSASMSLDTLAASKRGSGGGVSDTNESDPSDVVFPLRPSESMFCRHYERDYGPPVYIVQEIPPQSPANIYYKV